MWTEEVAAQRRALLNDALALLNNPSQAAEDVRAILARLYPNFSELMIPVPPGDINRGEFIAVLTNILAMQRSPLVSPHLYNP